MEIAKLLPIRYSSKCFTNVADQVEASSQSLTPALIEASLIQIRRHPTW